jgi:tRNA G18 (ribose-2'-O)-methylase SpoU
MATVEHVDDPDDPRLVELTGLTDAAARAATEAEHGCFVVEGLLALEAVLESPYGLRSVLVSDRRLDRVLPVVDRVDVTCYVGSQSLLESVTGFPIHRGVVASAGRQPLPAVAELLAGARRVAVLEGVNDHENIGALFRNAAAFGIDAVLLDPATADPLYRRSVRVSLGHVLRVPWTRLDPLPAGLRAVRAAGLTTVALAPGGDHDIRAMDADRVAWLVGAEGPGLTEDTLAAADLRVRIPLAAGVDSLNVATAAAVAFALVP